MNTRITFTETSFKDGVVVGRVAFYQAGHGVIGTCTGDISIHSSGFTPWEGQNVLPRILSEDGVYDAAQNLMHVYFQTRLGNKDAYVWVMDNHPLEEIKRIIRESDSEVSGSAAVKRDLRIYDRICDILKENGR